MATDQKPVFKIPLSGYGEFNSYFNSCYDEAEGELLEKNPHWLDKDGDRKDKYDDDCIGGACDIAEKATIKHIRSLGYRIRYPPKEPPKNWPKE